jgi:hypothetical protein
MGAVVASGSVLLGTYSWMQRNVVQDSEPSTSTSPKKKKQKMKMSLGESAKFLLNSKYIRNLATLVIAYGMCINLVEVSWKSKIKVRTSCDYNILCRIQTFKLTSHPCNSKHFPTLMIIPHSWAISVQLWEPLR